MNTQTLKPAKPPEPVRITYQLTTASGDLLKAQDNSQITVRY